MSKKFTKSEIKALAGAGIMFEIAGRDISIAKPYEGKLRDGLTISDIDEEATLKMVEKAKSIIPELGGFSCRWGGWILRKNYVDRSAGHDYCDVSSPHHY